MSYVQIVHNPCSNLNYTEVGKKMIQIVGTSLVKLPSFSSSIWTPNLPTTWLVSESRSQTVTVLPKALGIPFLVAMMVSGQMVGYLIQSS